MFFNIKVTPNILYKFGLDVTCDGIIYILIHFSTLNLIYKALISQIWLDLSNVVHHAYDLGLLQVDNKTFFG